MRHEKEILIRSLDRPEEKDADKMIEWFCKVLGLSSSGNSSEVEKDILKEFLFAAQKGEGLSSNEIRIEISTPKSTVIYHINRFIDNGIVIRKGRKYYLRANEMSKIIEEIEYDIDREMKRMINIAREFDRLFSNFSDEEGETYGREE